MRARNHPLRVLLMGVALAMALLANRGISGVENTAHNLSTRSGRGRGDATEACNFCHVPHNAKPTRALWNRPLSDKTYTTYSSPTLDSPMNQPTGSSRLCLSCHDGTIAMGNLHNSRGQGLALGTMKGKSSLGTDLSDDHPISFVYNPELRARNDELADPLALPHPIQLDKTGQLQCTSCHDAHEERNPKFLVMDNRLSALCTSCHRMKEWSSTIHATSAANLNDSGSMTAADSLYETVAENGCGNCHRSHSAGRPQWLMQFADAERNCLDCHGGGNAAANIAREFKKRSAHPLEGTKGTHRPDENPGLMSRHTTCSDCHGPHAMQAGADSLAPLPPSLKGATGVTSSGAAVPLAGAEYEVCYRCHGLQEQPRAMMIRQDHTTNSRLEFDPANRSFHPVVVPGRQPNLPGLLPGSTVAGRLQCSSCHRGEGDSRGPHGSAYEPILAREYRTERTVPESFQTYALCYQCHDRAELFAERNGFPHRAHVLQARASCATCHDAHGARLNTHLINFQLRDRQGVSVVTASRNGRLEYQSLGAGQGSCSLSCHGSDHDVRKYPVVVVAPKK